MGIQATETNNFSLILYFNLNVTAVLVINRPTSPIPKVAKPKPTVVAKKSIKRGYRNSTFTLRKTWMQRTKLYHVKGALRAKF